LILYLNAAGLHLNDAGECHDFFPNTLREAYLTLVNAIRAVLQQHPAMVCQGTHGPIVRAQPRDKYLRLIDAARKLSPVTTAIAHPCDEVLLEGVMEARRLRLTEPMLVGPPARIRDVAARHGIDVADLPIIESAHSLRAQSQSWFRREGGGPGSAGEGWSFDEGQSAHGRIDGCGRCARYRQ
jgi:hypothetical protein